MHDFIITPPVRLGCGHVNRVVLKAGQPIPEACFRCRSPEQAAINDFSRAKRRRKV